jgi:hypothetical protein
MSLSVFSDVPSVGEGDTNIGEGKASKPDRLMSLYNDPKFVPSIRLGNYKSIL